jgi:hypothetical protein
MHLARLQIQVVTFPGRRKDGKPWLVHLRDFDRKSFFFLPAFPAKNYLKIAAMIHGSRDIRSLMDRYANASGKTQRGI